MKMNMVLLTVINKKIYWEYKWHGSYKEKAWGQGEANLLWQWSNLEEMIQRDDFPEYIQFWFRIGYDRLHLDTWYNGERFDLKHP